MIRQNGEWYQHSSLIGVVIVQIYFSLSLFVCSLNLSSVLDSRSHLWPMKLSLYCVVLARDNTSWLAWKCFSHFSQFELGFNSTQSRKNSQQLFTPVQNVLSVHHVRVAWNGATVIVPTLWKWESSFCLILCDGKSINYFQTYWTHYVLFVRMFTPFR